MSASRKYYPFVDGFRAIAIFFVLTRHVREGFQLKDLFARDTPSLEWLYAKAWQLFHIDLSPAYLSLQFALNKTKGLYGVEMFLVMSGFLITSILFEDGRQRITAGRFYLRRFFKIYPSYVLLVLTGFTFLFFDLPPQARSGIWMSLVHYLLFLQNYYPANPFLAHTWTLVVIEQFYFFCPLVIMAACGLTASPAQRRWLLIAVCVAVMGIGAWARLHYQQTAQPLLAWPLQAPVPVQTTLCRFDAIAFGCLLALLEPYWGRMKKNIWLGGLLWTASVGIYYVLVFKSQWGYFKGAWYLYTMGYIAFAGLLLAAFHGFSFLARLKPLQWVGRQSYGIYLWHYVLLPVWGCFLGLMPLPLVITGYILSCVAVGALSTRTVERYFLLLRERVAPKEAA